MLSSVFSGLSGFSGSLGQDHATDISVGHWAKATVAGVINGAIDSVGAFGVAADTAIRGSWKNLSALWKSDQIGFDSKVFLSAAGVPAAVALLVPTATLAGGAYGFVQGYDRVLNRGASLFGVAKAAVKDAKEFESIPAGREEILADYLLSSAPQDGRPYDVSLPRAVGTAVAALASGVILATATSALSLYRTPEMLGNVLFKIGTAAENQPLRKITQAQVAIGLAAYANALLPLGAFTLGYGQALVKGHTEGYNAAMAATYQALVRIYQGSRDVIENVDLQRLV